MHTEQLYVADEVYFNVPLTYKSDISISRAVLVYCYNKETYFTGSCVYIYIIPGSKAPFKTALSLNNTRVRLSVVSHDLLISSHIDACI